MNQLAKRLSEVYAILSCLDEKEKMKIPKKVWNEIQNKKSKTYKYNYIPGDEQKLDDYTLAILCKIHLEYLKSN